MAAPVASFFDPATHTVTHVVKDPGSSAAAIIDPVLDYDPASGTIGTASADKVRAFVMDQGLNVSWVLETHVHADHLSAAFYFRERLGAQMAIGAQIASVQDVWSARFNYKPGLAPDPSQFDRLLEEGDKVRIGGLEGEVMSTPGHTAIDVSYRFGGRVFIGDTLFMPDYGCARCDFPGGNARALWRSIHKLLSLPDETQLYLCHDYLPKEGRAEHAWVSTVAEQKRENVWLKGQGEAGFVERREARDRELAVPALLYPSLQVNIRAGRPPPPEDNGVSYMKIPIATKD